MADLIKAVFRNKKNADGSPFYCLVSEQDFNEKMFIRREDFDAEQAKKAAKAEPKPEAKPEVAKPKDADKAKS